MFSDNKTQFNVINTNACLLRPKISSFLTCFLNLAMTLAIVTETWFAQGNSLDLRSEELLMGHGIKSFTLSRDPHPSTGVAYGGVAIFLRDSITKANVYQFPNPEKFEVLPLSVTVADVSRKLFVLAAYIPPGYAVGRGRACLHHIADIVLMIKNRHEDSLVLVAGDFNQWDISSAMAEFSDMTEVSTPPTRDGRKIDKMFTNWHGDVEEGGCIPPLQTEVIDGQSTTSDHSIQYLMSRLPRREPIRWETFTHRPYTQGGEENFMADIAAQDWVTLKEKATSNEKTDALHHILNDLLDRHFPLKTCTRKESDLPWLDKTARKMIKKKRAIYKSEGQSVRWLAMREKVDRHLDARREVFLEKQRDKFIGPQAHVKKCTKKN